MSRKKAPSKKEQREAILRDLEIFPAVAILPMHSQNEQKIWFNDSIINFGLHLAKRGATTENGMTFTHQLFVGGFCDVMHLELMGEEHEQYYFLIGHEIYAYLTNHHKRGSPGIKLQHKVTKKLHLYGQDFWARENKDEFTARLARHREENPGFQLTVGHLRSVTGKFFKEQTKEIQEQYRTKAKEELRRLNTVERLEGEEKEAYIHLFPKVRSKLLKEAEICTKILVFAQVLTEQSDGVFTLKGVVSDGMKSFAKSSNMGEALQLTKVWVEETAGKQLDGGPLAPAVYPNMTNNLFPILPKYGGMKGPDLQKLFRAWFTKAWHFDGGGGAIPWEMIQRSIEAGEDKWLDQNRMPAGAVWTDPGSMKVANILTWFEHITDKKLPVERQFQFKTTLASVHPSTIPNPQFKSFEPSKRRDQDVWELMFTETITTCQLPSGMFYLKESWAYGRFLTTGDYHNLGVTHPAEWNGLPAFDSNRPLSVIQEGERALIEGMVAQLPDDNSALLLWLVDAINKHEAKIPALTFDGIWSHKESLPVLIPAATPSPDESAQFLSNFWVPKIYYGLAKGSDEIAPFLHEQSGTLLGGDSGSVWMVRTLIALVLNLAAVKHLIEPPIPVPTGYDLSRLPIGEFDRVLGWCQDWIAGIEQSTSVLEQTFDARVSEEFLMSAEDFAKSTEQEHQLILGEGKVEEDKAREDKQQGGDEEVETGGDTGKAKPWTKSSKRKPAKKSKRKKPAKVNNVDADMMDVVLPEEETSDSEDGSSEDSSDKVGDGKVKEEELLFSEHEVGSVAQYIVMSPQGKKQSNLKIQTSKYILLYSNGKTAPISTIKGPSKKNQPNTPQHVFGPFLPTPAPVWSLFNGLNALKSFGQSTMMGRDQPDTEWNKLARQFSPLTPADYDRANMFDTSFNRAWWPLVATIFLRRITWDRAEACAPYIMKIALKIDTFMQAGCHFMSCAERFKEVIKGHPSAEDIDMDLVDSMVTALNHSVGRYRCIRGELATWEAISTHWSGQTKMKWKGEIPGDPESLQLLVKGLFFWAVAVDKQQKQNEVDRDKLCQGLGLPPSSFAQSWYQFDTLNLNPALVPTLEHPESEDSHTSELCDLASMKGHPSAEDIDMDLVDSMVTALNHSVGRYRCIRGELATWEAISTHWSGQTKMKWKGEIPGDPESLQLLVKGLFFWAVAVDKQQKQNEVDRDKLCQGLGLPPSSFAQSWYQFDALNLNPALVPTLEHPESEDSHTSKLCDLASMKAATENGPNHSDSEMLVEDQLETTTTTTSTPCVEVDPAAGEGFAAGAAKAAKVIPDNGEHEIQPANMEGVGGKVVEGIEAEREQTSSTPTPALVGQGVETGEADAKQVTALAGAASPSWEIAKQDVVRQPKGDTAPSPIDSISAPPVPTAETEKGTSPGAGGAVASVGQQGTSGGSKDTEMDGPNAPTTAEQVKEVPRKLDQKRKGVAVVEGDANAEVSAPGPKTRRQRAEAEAAAKAASAGSGSKRPRCGVA
ncbi:hypothetical protein BDV93DRAFT_511091 [Ceratobasidium sp. AG-I]|nr:hypothetical protein BDV93DRAFT_511091 [Ceratobasidium sp. AG-I]